jgi:hypothetical protein
MIVECALDGDHAFSTAREIDAHDAMTPSPVCFTSIPPVALKRSRMMPFTLFLSARIEVHVGHDPVSIHCYN